jgi:hypothetical protein
MVGKRVRVAGITVQMEDRRPVRVVRRVYFVVSFDDGGRLDAKRFLQQQWALSPPQPSAICASRSGRAADASLCAGERRATTPGR